MSFVDVFKQSLHSIRRSSEPDQSGFALVMVLWGVALLGLIAALFSESSRSGVAIAQQLASRIADEQIAQAAVAQIIVDFSRPTSQRVWNPDGTPHALSFETADAVVRLFDEDGKVSVNRASEQMLANLLSATTHTANAIDVARAIVHLRSLSTIDAMDGSPPGTLADKDAARHGAFISLDELRAVVGMTDESYAAICPFATVYSQRNVPDRRLMATALREILSAEQGDDQIVTDSVEVSSTYVPSGLGRGNGLTRSEPASQSKTYSLQIAVSDKIGGRRSVFLASLQINLGTKEALGNFVVPLHQADESHCNVFP